MCDDDIHQGLVQDPTVSRRTFGLAAAATVGVAATAQAQARVVETDVTVKTPDGAADAVLFHPAGAGRWPAVLVWPDALGLRPVFREMGRRLAAEGYVVLVPNPFYRVRRAPVIEGPFDFSNPADRARLQGLREGMSEGLEKDAAAYVAFLDAQPQTDRSRRIGVQGYCMGGPLSFRTAVAQAQRIGAVASFHGGGLVTGEPTSPHLHVGKARAEYLVLIGDNDDKQQPEAKDELAKAFATAGRPAKVEVYPAAHGWTVRGSQVYDEARAERAWSELLALYKRALS